MGRRLGRGHPSIAIAAVVLVGYVGLTALMVAVGALLTHVLAHAAIGHWDDHANAYLAHHRHPFWNRVSGDATVIANTLGIVVIAAVVTAFLLLRHWGRRAMLLLIALAVELSVFLTTNYVVARPRPHVPHLGSTPSTFSWPSGHAAATLALYGGIAVLVMAATRWIVPRAVAWVVAVGLTALVAFSRVYRGEHHPLDVVGGAVLGVLALWIAAAALRAADTVARVNEDNRPHAAAAHPQEAEPSALVAS